MDCQDWETVTVKRAVAKPKHTPVSHDVAVARRIENDESPKIKGISSESRQQIIQKRVENKWNQQQLNVQCAFPANTIRDIESGRVHPTPHQLNTLSRVLKIVLKYES